MESVIPRSAATLVGAHDPLPDLLEQLRATFGLASASVFELTGKGWWPTHASGHPELLDPSEGTSIDISADGKLRLVVSNNALRPEQLEVLRAFADQSNFASVRCLQCSMNFSAIARRQACWSGVAPTRDLRFFSGKLGGAASSVCGDPLLL